MRRLSTPATPPRLCRPGRQRRCAPSRRRSQPRSSAPAVRPMLSPRLALQMSRGAGRCRIYDRRDKPHFVVFGNDRLSFPDLPPPAKQLLRRQSVSPRHAGNRVAATLDLGDDPRLVLVAPAPPASRTGENLQPACRLSDSIIHCVHSKPNGQSTSRRLADQDVNRKVIPEQRLLSTPYRARSITPRPHQHGSRDTPNTRARSLAQCSDTAEWRLEAGVRPLSRSRFFHFQIGKQS
jgi:hypothetical protein